MTERFGNLVSGLLALSGLMCLAGALIVRQTGHVVYLPDGSQFRTHQEAFLVLLVLGLALLVNTVIVWFHTQQPTPPEQRSDWEWCSAAKHPHAQPHDQREPDQQQDQQLDTHAYIPPHARSCHLGPEFLPLRGW